MVALPESIATRSSRCGRVVCHEDRHQFGSLSGGEGGNEGSHLVGFAN